MELAARLSLKKVVVLWSDDGPQPQQWDDVEMAEAGRTLVAVQLVTTEQL